MKQQVEAMEKGPGFLLGEFEYSNVGHHVDMADGGCDWQPPDQLED